MVKRAKSEYAKRYNSHNDICGPLHVQNFGIRCSRRSRECMHNRDSFIWDDGSDLSDEYGQGDIQKEADPRPMSAPLHRYKHEKFNKTYQINKEKEEAERKQILIHELENKLNAMDVNDRQKRGTPPTPPPSVEEKPEFENRQVQTSKWGKAEGNFKGTYNIEVDDDKKVTRLCRQLRPKSAPPSRKRKPYDPETPGRFLSYGYGDKELETAIKRTWNVQSPVHVYPSALRAQKRRKAEIELREKKAREAPLGERRKRALFNDFNEKMKRDTSAWETEYRRCYRGYDQSEYAKINTHRSKSKLAFTA